METAVIIPNYNGEKFLSPCMSALKNQTYRDFRVIIVDNGSADGSVPLLREWEKEGSIDAVYLPENTGFSGAVNTGIEHALENNAKYIVLLNNDTEACPDYLWNMVRVMEQDKEGKTGAVTPLMLNYFDRSLIDSAGDGYAVCGWAYQRGVGQNKDRPRFTVKREAFSACAGACLYSAEALKKIRFSDGEIFDLKHFAYLEDVDVSFRLRTEGYRIVFEPSSVVYHYGSGTSGSRYNDFKVRLAARNNVYLNWKNMPLLMLLINFIPIMAGVLLKWAFFISMGFGKTYIKGFLEGIKNLPGLRSHVIFYRPERTFNYLRTELFMIKDMFIYLWDLYVRHIKRSV